MKIQIQANDLVKVFPQYEKELNNLYEQYSDILEKHNYKINQIKDKDIKAIFETQLSTKEDFNIEVIHNNKDWDIVNYETKVLLPLLLRNDKIVLNWDDKNLNNIELTDYINKKYNISVSKYEEINYVGEGKINWDTITKEVKESWNSSFFYLDNMHNKQFVENNKELILEKVINDEKLLKETMEKSIDFFQFAKQKVSAKKLLKVFSDKEGYLSEIWQTKVNKIISRTNYKALIKREEEVLEEELKYYWDYLVKNSVNSYGEITDFDQYEKMKKNLNKQYKEKEVEIKKEVEQNTIIVEEINELLKDDSLRINLIKGLLKNDASMYDFNYFIKDILNNAELKEIVINRGIYKSLAPNKDFIEALNIEDFGRFMHSCNNKITKASFVSDYKKQFEEIVSEEKLLAYLISKEDIINTKWEILSTYNAKNKQLKKCLFKLDPKERFSDLSKEDITEKDIRDYMNAGGYAYVVRDKLNIYQLKEIETIKLICIQNNDILNSKKTPVEWRNNPEIIKAIIMTKGNLEDCGLKKENILVLSQDLTFTKEMVSHDKTHIFYKYLPEKLKNNQQVAIALLDSTKEIEEVIKLFPEFILNNKRFNIELIKKLPNAIKHIQDEMWNDKQFVLTLLYEIETTPKEKEIVKNLPTKIKLFFETFNVQENYYSFFNNYHLQKKLEEKLVTNEPRQKEKKNKI